MLRLVVLYYYFYYAQSFTFISPVEVPLDQVYEEWKKSISPSHIKESATYFGIYADLFGDAYFKPVIPIDIAYKQGAEAAEEILVPVYRGNIVKPSEVSLTHCNI